MPGGGPRNAKPTSPIAAAIAVAWGRSRISRSAPVPGAGRDHALRVAWQRSEQDVSPVLIVRLVCHLWLEALAGEVPIQQPGRTFAPDGLHRRVPISISRGPCSIAQMTLSAMDSGRTGWHRLRLLRQLVTLADGLWVFTAEAGACRAEQRCHRG